MRRKITNRKIVGPDFIYNSPKLEKFIEETRTKLSEIIKRVRRDYELDAYDE